MNQRLCIGIQKLTPAWEIVLDQLGVWFEEIDYHKALKASYSLILLNAKPENAQIQMLDDYLFNSGGVLEMKGNSVFFDQKNIHSQAVRTLYNYSSHNGFRHIPFIDIHSKIEKHRNSQLFEGLIHFKSYKKGDIGFFGADVSELIQNTAYSRKRFYHKSGRYPDEIVSRVSKHELMDAFSSTLKEMHYFAGMPFVQKWTSPAQNPVFGFRVDSDFGDRESIDKLRSVIETHQVSATWFLHVEAHESWLQDFQNFGNQEIALHGYQHGTSNSKAKTTDNITLGNKALEQAGFEPKGFCAPYGIWNDALKQALTEFDFTYSSEFTFGHDGFPIQPIENKLPLQIPIHPICTGSLNRQRFSIEQMKDYFESVLRFKLGRFHPVFFYHHPLQPGLEAINYLFDVADEAPLHKTSFGQYADFWNARKQFSYKAFTGGQTCVIEEISDPNFWLQVSFDHSGFNLVKSKGAEINKAKSPDFEYTNTYLPTVEESIEMHKNTLRLIKTSLFDWKNRIRL